MYSWNALKYNMSSSISFKITPYYQSHIIMLYANAINNYPLMHMNAMEFTFVVSCLAEKVVHCRATL